MMMMTATEDLFRDDAQLRECCARVLGFAT